jgi:hypothetical protein
MTRGALRWFCNVSTYNIRGIEYQIFCEKKIKKIEIKIVGLLGFIFRIVGNPLMSGI